MRRFAFAFNILLLGWVSVCRGDVTVNPGDNLQDLVNSNPAETTFILAPGVYRQQSVTSLKSGDIFSGQSGAILDGAALLSGWVVTNVSGTNYWTLDVPPGDILNDAACGARHCCQDGTLGCAYVQNLYVDNVDFKHVIFLGALTSAGQWFLDYSGVSGPANRLYMYDAVSPGDNPSTHTVELGATRYAFQSTTATHVTVQGLVIEKYAPQLQHAAIQPQASGWLIQNNEVRLNHGFGIKPCRGGDNVQVLNNNIHDNGEMGLGTGRVNGGLFDSNEIWNNNIDQVNAGFEAGGTKFVGHNLMISNNIVHDNGGPGLWTDQGGTHNTYDHNTSYNNQADGIRYEISRYGTITNNTVYGNGRDPQIVYTGSDHGRISGNAVTTNGPGKAGIGISVQNITGTRVGAIIYMVTDTQVTNNTIFISGISDVGAQFVDYARPSQPNVFSDPTNFFSGNSYHVRSLLWRRLSWAWGENAANPKRVNYSTWRANASKGHRKDLPLVSIRGPAAMSPTKQ